MADTQDLVVDLKIKDNLSVGLANAKQNVQGFDDATTKANASLAATEARLAKTSASFTNLGSSITNSVKAFIGIGSALKGLEFFGDAIKNAQDDEASVARLTAALHANVEAWDGNTLAIEKAIDAGARLGFSDDEIRASITRLSAATHDLGQSLQLQNVAMDLARFKNVDLATATDALVSIEAGRFRGLAALGIELKAGTTQVQALAAVQAVAAGSAKAFGETSAGAAKEAGIAMSEAAEAIGKGLLPVITDLSKFAKDDLAPALTVVGENMDKILPVAEALALAFGTKLALGLIKSTAAFAANTAALIANAIAAQAASGATGVLATTETLVGAAATTAAVQTELLAVSEVSAAAGATSLAAAEVSAAAGATALGTAAGTAATGGVAALLAGLKVILAGVATSAPAFQLGGELTHKFAAETAEAGFKTRDYADALQRLNDAVAFGSITQAEADAILLRVAGTLQKTTGALEGSTAARLAFERAESAGAATSDKAAAASIGVSVAQLAVAKATIDAGHAHAALSDAQKDAAAAADGDTAAVVLLAAAQAADKTATDALKVANDALAASIKEIPPAMLGLGSGIGTLSDDLLRGSNAAIIAAGGYGLLADQIDRLKRTGGKPFVAPNVTIPGLDSGAGGLAPGGMSLAESFIDTLLLHNKNLSEAEARAALARAKALADAKTAASAYADVLAGKLDAALKKEKNTADILFDALHARHLQAIADTEKLAEKQHDTALQAISDALKVRLAANAAPVDAAERRQQQIELSRQRRDLGESLQAAQQSGDPEAIRRASEALQSFNAAQRIAALKVDQATKDLAAQTEAAAQQKAADDKLAAAKLAQAAGIEDENKRFKKQTDDFDRALAALKIRDKGASPGKIAKDISDLEGKFGITRDSAGHSHIDDPLVIAIKTIKIPAPTVNLYPTFYSPPIFLNGRLIASALASNLSPAATPGVRTGTLTPKAAG